MNTMQIGLITGLILGIAAVVGGFSGFLITIALGVIGLVVGRVLDGDLAVSELFGRGRDK